MLNNIKIKRKWIKNSIKLCLIIFTISIAIMAILHIKKIGILPNKYFYMLIGIELFFCVVSSFLLIKFEKKIWLILGIVIMICMNVGNIIINNYVHKANSFIDKTFQGYMLIETDYIVITSTKNNLNSLDDIEENQILYYFKYSRDIDLALKKINKGQFTSIDSISNALTTIDQNIYVYLLISKADYDYLINGTIWYSKDNYKIIKEFTIQHKEKINNEVKDSYTIYLNGTDFTGVMRDFNLLITINTKTKKILTTSILRGYYIDVPAYNMKDTLMCLGAYDSNVSKEAIEKLLDIKIDYIVNVNTNSLVDIVDAIGGVEFCSDYEFRTTHILTKDTYNDKIGRKLVVVKGCKEYNGVEALAITRERLHLRNNERGRIENCQKILMSIIKKSITTTSLLNFDEVLNSYNNLYTTDMNRNVITELIKTYINDYNGFEIIRINLDGNDGTAMGHLGTAEVGVTFPNEAQVQEASLKIKEVIEGVE